MLRLTSDRNLNDGLVDGLRGPLEEATSGRSGFYQAHVYGGGGRAGEIVVRLSTAYAVVPIILRASDLEPARVLALFKSALARVDA